jgi:hypothetical protein
MASAVNHDADDRTRDSSGPRRVFDWLFRDRTTCKVVIAQWPNVPLWIFIAAAAVRGVLHPAGTVGTVVSAIATLALTWWAVDEVARGVNPFRRALGAVVLVAMVANFIMR